MDCLIDTFVPSSIYNSLPHINDVSDAPEQQAQDLADLRELLVKHNVPRDVSIRLIHKHFDTREGEVMVFGSVDIPNQGTVQTMTPVLVSTGNSTVTRRQDTTDTEKLRGIHYFVNDQGALQAYEYATYGYDLPDAASFEAFAADFCRTVAERGLQRKFGLKLKRHDDKLDGTGWTEFDFHQKRSTVMLPEGMPMPTGDSGPDSFTVTTEWKGPDGNRPEDGPRQCRHITTCTHCRHCARHTTTGHDGDHADCHEHGLYLGGQEIVPGTPIHQIVSALVEVM